MGNSALPECPFAGFENGGRGPAYEWGGRCRAGRNFNAIDGCCGQAMKTALLFYTAGSVAEAVKGLHASNMGNPPNLRLGAARAAFTMFNSERGTGSPIDLELAPVREALNPPEI